MNTMEAERYVAGESSENATNYMDGAKTKGLSTTLSTGSIRRYRGLWITQYLPLVII